jgi:uncharacterized protein (TIGR03118 family)
MVRTLHRSATARRLASGLAVMVSAAALAAPALAGGYQITPLVTNTPSTAPTTDPNLVNPWGIASSPTGPWWVANAFGGTATSGTAGAYTGSGAIAAPAVSIPQDGGGGGGPAGAAGVVYAGGDGFAMPGGGSAQFIYSNLDGSISAWSSGTGAVQVVPGRTGGNIAVYPGLGIGSSGGANYIYAANNITGQIDVFNTSFQQVTLAGTFTDPNANPAGLVPFNVQNINGQLWVPYAVPGPGSDDVAAGTGFVDIFNTDGTFVKRFATGGALQSPWGIALAPSDFGQFSNDVLIGNFQDDGDAVINAYDPTSGAFEGVISDFQGNPISAPGLWGIGFGNGGAAGPTDALYIAAGINDEAGGLFAEITPVPEPQAWLLMIVGVGLIGSQLRATRRRMQHA